VSHRVLRVLAVAFVLGRATLASAADSPSVDDVKAAESDFNHGREAYKAGSYNEAADYFESADTHAPNDRVLELAINARDRAGHLDRAATLSELAITRYPSSDRLRKVAEPLLERAHTELLAVTVDCTDACTLLDGERIVHGDAAAHRVVYLSPGDHTIRAGWSADRTDSKPVTGKAGDTVSIQFTAPPLPKVEEAAPLAGPTNPVTDNGPTVSPKPLPPVVFWSGLGATVALGAITTWSGVDTLNNPGKDKVRAECNPTPKSDCQSLYDEGRNHQTRTNVLIGATSVVGVATAVIGLFFTNWKGHASGDASAETGVSPWVAYDRGPSVGATGRF